MIKNTNISTTEQTVHFDTSAETALKERKRQQEKALHDEASNLHWAREEGFKEGFEKGFKEGKMIIKLFMQGYDTKSIAERLSLSEDDVKELLNR